MCNHTLPIWYNRRDGVLNPVEISVGMTDRWLASVRQITLERIRKWTVARVSIAPSTDFAGFRADQVLAQLDSDVRRTPALAVFRNREIRRITYRVRIRVKIT